MTEDTGLTKAQEAYNAAQYEMWQLAAYGHYRYHPSGESLTDQGQRELRDYIDRIQTAREGLETAVLRLVADHGGRYRTLPEPVVGWLRALADDPGLLSLLAVRPDEREEVLDECPAAEADAYEHTTGHLIACLAVIGGEADPDCPCQAEHPWIYRVTALPSDGRPPQSQYYPDAHRAKFWRDEVTATGYRTTVGRIPAEAFQSLPEGDLDRLAEEERNRAQKREGL